MLVKASASRSEIAGKKNAVVLACRQLRAFEERDRFIEDRRIAGDLDVMSGGISEPRLVVGDPRAHALA